MCSDRRTGGGVSKAAIRVKAAVTWPSRPVVPIKLKTVTLASIALHSTAPRAGLTCINIYVTHFCYYVYVITTWTLGLVKIFLLTPFTLHVFSNYSFHMLDLDM